MSATFWLYTASFLLVDQQPYLSLLPLHLKRTMGVSMVGAALSELGGVVIKTPHQLLLPSLAWEVIMLATLWATPLLP